MIDLTITITSLLALCAIISPIFTAIINNKYQLKSKKKIQNNIILYLNKQLRRQPKLPDTIQQGAL